MTSDGRLSNEELADLRARLVCEWDASVDARDQAMAAQEAVGRLFNHLATLQRSADEMREALKYIVAASSHLHGMGHITGTARRALEALPPQQDAKDGATNG